MSTVVTVYKIGNGPLNITGEQRLNSFCVQMSTWARRGRLTKTASATYLITPALLTTVHEP